MTQAPLRPSCPYVFYRPVSPACVLFFLRGLHGGAELMGCRHLLAAAPYCPMDPGGFPTARLNVGGSAGPTLGGGGAVRGRLEGSLEVSWGVLCA